MSADSPSSGASITVVRTIAAPIAQVFAAWTDPVLLQRWLAPGRCEVVEARADARPGGTYRIVVLDPVGNRHTTTGVYREVVPRKRLVQTWVYEGVNAVDPYPTLLTVDFRELGPRSTELKLHQEQLLTPEYREGNREGWRLCLDKLEALLRE